MNGILLVDKPKEHTSFDVIARLRKATKIKRIGHTGTLDPMATGVLPVLFGRSAKFADLLPVSDKRYRGKVKLGLTTDTLDITGNIMSETISKVSLNSLNEVLQSFRGKILQLPPMYSAVKVNGVRLYDLARQGVEAERAQREVEIKALELLDFDEKKQTFELDVLCSKGTYIRTLCADIGEKLGCGAVLTDLCRTAACGFALGDCVSLETCLEEDISGMILPPDSALKAYPKVVLPLSLTEKYRNGVKLSLNIVTSIDPDTDYIRVYDSKDKFLGLSYPDFKENTLRIKVLYDNLPEK